MAKLKFDRVVNLRIRSDEIVTVPAGELWKVTIARALDTGEVSRHDPAAPAYYAAGTRLKINNIGGNSVSVSHLTGAVFIVI